MMSSGDKRIEGRVTSVFRSREGFLEIHIRVKDSELKYTLNNEIWEQEQKDTREWLNEKVEVKKLE